MTEASKSDTPTRVGLSEELGVSVGGTVWVFDLNRRVYRERTAALKELERAHLETLLRLATAAELRDDDTGVHIVRSPAEMGRRMKELLG